MKLHIAKEGDTLKSLSERYAVELERLTAANPQIQDWARVEPGEKVKIPTAPVQMQVENVQPLPQPAPMPNQSNQQPAAPFMVEAATENQQISHAPNEPQANIAPAANEAPLAPVNVASNVSPMMPKVAPKYENVSPMDVKWTGMNDDVMHPFMQMPLPSYPAGMTEPFMQMPLPPYQGGAAEPFAHIPMTHFPGGAIEPMVSPVHSPMGGVHVPHNPDSATTNMAPMVSPFGHQPNMGPFLGPCFGMMPSYGAGSPMAQVSPYGHGFGPHGAPYPFPPPAHDCGCGGAKIMGRPELPYSLPDDSGDAATRSIETNETDQREDEPQQDKKPKTRKKSKEAAVSSQTDTLKAFLKRSKMKKKPARLSSKPWVRN